jgi:ribosomal protein S27AE
MTDVQKLYTLAEAREQLARAECVERGHSYVVHEVVGVDGPDRVICGRCGRGWSVVRS